MLERDPRHTDRSERALRHAGYRCGKGRLRYFGVI